MEIFNGYPLEELIIHPRVREDFYSGTPRLDAFSVAYEVRKAPICYNGDIFTVEDLETIEREFPQITAVMIGRGVLRHPGADRTAAWKRLTGKIGMGSICRTAEG